MDLLRYCVRVIDARSASLRPGSVDTTHVRARESLWDRRRRRLPRRRCGGAAHRRIRYPLDEIREPDPIGRSRCSAQVQRLSTGAARRLSTTGGRSAADLARSLPAESRDGDQRNWTAAPIGLPRACADRRLKPERGVEPLSIAYKAIVRIA